MKKTLSVQIGSPTFNTLMRIVENANKHNHAPIWHHNDELYKVEAATPARQGYISVDLKKCAQGDL